MKIIAHWVAGLTIVAGLAAAGSAEAMPIAPPSTLADATSVLQVRDGCGPGGHRSHYGYCKPNGYGFGYGYGRPGFYGARPFYGPRRFYRPRPFYGRRCFIRETYYGPRRVCRY